jgi:hypothetical protein
VNRREFETFLKRRLLNAQEHTEEFLDWTGKMVLPVVKIQFWLRCTHCGASGFHIAGSLQEISTVEIDHNICETEFAKGRVLEEAIYRESSRRGGGVDNTTCSIFEYSIPEDALEVA